MPMTKEEFNDNRKSRFKQAIATAADVKVTDVTIAVLCSVVIVSIKDLSSVLPVSTPLVFNHGVLLLAARAAA
jgi:hypothetical protein